MPRRPHLSSTTRRPLLLGAAGVAALSLLSACGDDAVEVERFSVTSVGKDSCAKFLDALPDEVSDASRRRTTGSSFAAAYGDPAIVVRCGVGVPESFDKFSACQRANDIDWYVEDVEDVSEDQSRDVLMTTVGRTPSIQVALPADYRPPTTAMIDLEKTIESTTEKTGGCV